MDNNTPDFLEQLVVRYMHQGDAFTSLDITNQAKDAGHRVRNHEVASWLRSNAVRLAHEHSHLYNQSLITVDSKAVGQTLAYLYHHYQEDTDVYLDRDQNPKSFQPTVHAGTPASTLTPFIASRQTGKTLTTNVAVGTMFFQSREKAREYARYDSAFKFQDQGSDAAGFGERWSCVPR